MGEIHRKKVEPLAGITPPPPPSGATSPKAKEIREIAANQLGTGTVPSAGAPRSVVSRRTQILTAGGGGQSGSGYLAAGKG